MESGSHLWARGGTPVYTGRISGTGTIHTQGYGQTITLTGELDGNFTVYFGQRGGVAYLKNTAIRQPVTLKYNTSDNIGAASSGTLRFYLQLAGYDAQPTYVPIKVLVPTLVKNNIGCTLYTYARLPRHVRGLAGTLRVGEGTTNPTWNFPFDPSLDDPDLAGCEGSGTLEVPASGTLRLSFASADALPRGKWPLLTGTSGGEALSEEAWPVVYAEGPRPGNFSVVRDATGVWLQAVTGTTVIFR